MIPTLDQPLMGWSLFLRRLMNTMNPFRVIPGIVIFLLLCLPLSSTLADDWHFPGVNRIVAVGDIHGAYDAMLETFQQAAVIDDSLAWTGADTHLVLTGDLLDRGPDSRLVMDFIMRLEREAARAGGQVHQLLGNHEIMNLVGDLRYVSDSEFAAFSADESAEEREQWYQYFQLSQPADTDELMIRSEFEKKTPPGFFGHRRAFRRNGHYGKWLLEKPIMIVINDTAFVHGGIPPYVAEQGLGGVNGALKMDLLNFLTAQSALVDEGVLSPVSRFRDLPAILVPKMEAGQLDGESMASARVVMDYRDSPLQGPVGPTWYRGTATCNSLIEGDGLKTALGSIGATRVVLGHTTTITRRIQQRMDGRIIEIDTGMLKASYQGSGNALIIEGDRLTVVNQDGTKDLSPIAHPQGVRSGSEVIDDDLLEDVLSHGVIVESKTDGTAWKLVQVTAGDKSVFAYFNASQGEKGFIPELAAYRLDRMLGLYMVPVTVRREINGQHGSLQFVPAAMLSERERVANGKGQRSSCSLGKQRGAMYVFDALIHNPIRTPLSMLYSPDNWQLMLVNHEKSFGTNTGRPAYLNDIDLAIGEQWRTALLEIDDEKLSLDLGDSLSKRRLAALIKRRDALIAESRQH